MRRPLDEGQFAATLTMLCATFRETADAGLIEGYWIGLEDLPIDAVCTAAKKAIGECPRMPSPVDLRRLAGAGDNVNDAWSDVIRQIASVGAYGKPQLDPDVREAVVACGGWKRLCSSTTEHLHSWIKREFAEALAAQRNKQGIIEQRKATRQLPAPFGEEQEPEDA